MGTIRRFEEIEAWQTARMLTRRIYALSSQGTFAKDYGLRDQMRRASVSIMSNIAEGFESDRRRDFIRYLGYAKASAGEVRAQLYVALDVGYLTREQFNALVDLATKCSGQIQRFMAYLKSSERSVHEGRFEYKTWERSNV
jgi:four helix bundle protein